MTVSNVMKLLHVAVVMDGGLYTVMVVTAVDVLVILI